MLRMVAGLIPAVCVALFSVSVQAEDVSKEQIKGLDEQVQEVKSEVLAVTAELNRLEEKLLYPSNTEVSLFVSLAAEADFRLDAVTIEIDGRPVANHIYSYKELEALRKGGVQRIHTGNVRTGKHPITVHVIGESATGREYRKTADFILTKEVGPKLVGVVLAGPGQGSDSIEVEDW